MTKRATSPKATASPRSARPVHHPLVGKWFHSFDRTGGVQWQGEVRASLGRGMLLVALYEWIIGHDDIERIVRVRDMASWHFYDSAAEMRQVYADRYAPRSARRQRRPQLVKAPQKRDHADA